MFKRQQLLQKGGRGRANPNQNILQKMHKRKSHSSPQRRPYMSRMSIQKYGVQGSFVIVKYIQGKKR